MTSHRIHLQKNRLFKFQIRIAGLCSTRREPSFTSAEAWMTTFTYTRSGGTVFGRSNRLARLHSAMAVLELDFQLSRKRQESLLAATIPSWWWQITTTTPSAC